jgi:hypothetical protein
MEIWGGWMGYVDDVGVDRGERLKKVLLEETGPSTCLLQLSGKPGS